MMINTTELKGLHFVIDENGGVTPISKELAIKINEQNDKLAKYESIKALDNESIVKTVDPDNLPHKTERVLVRLVGGLAIGYIRIDLFDEVWFYLLGGTKHAKLTSSDKYIEQKDLLGMFNDN